jgi:hypothetical protein
MAELSSRTNSVAKLVPVEMFLALGVVDGEGHKTTRLVIRADGFDDFQFVFRDKGVHEGSIPRMAKWMQDALQELAKNVEDKELPVTKVAIKAGAPIGG